MTDRAAMRRALASALLRLRVRKRWTMAEAAEEMGVSELSWWRWEMARALPYGPVRDFLEDTLRREGLLSDGVGENHQKRGEPR